MRNRPFHRPIHIDMTPFVSVAYMLIVFFVWLKMIQKEQEMVVIIPDNGKCECDYPYPDAALFLLDSNKVGFLTYHANEKSPEYIETNYTAQGLRKMLARQLTTEAPIILLKPTIESTFENLVDVLDEIRIHGRIRYWLIDEISPGEKKMMAAYLQFKQTQPSQPQTIRLTLYSGRIPYYLWQ